MSDREKLIELLESAESAVYWNVSDMGFIQKIADHLLSNGVTFQKWIPVTEREPVIDCLTIDDHGQIELARSISIITLPSKKKLYLANERAYRILSLLGEGDALVTCTHITHWMPLPEPPQENDHEDKG